MTALNRTLTSVVAVILSAGLIVLSLAACAPGLSQSEPEDLAEFANRETATYLDRELAYVDTGDVDKPLILFVHGTPGSWQAFEHYMRHPALRDRARMIAVDRLGFGRSNEGDVAPDFEDQSRSIAQLLDRSQHRGRPLLVGHSLGASIALRIATDFPDDVGGVLAISGGIDPALAKPRWYHRLADSWPIKHIIPEGLHRANEEMMMLESMLTSQSSALNTLPMPVEIIQGANDPLVDDANADYAERVIPRVMVHRFPDSGHFIVWEQPDFVVERIIALLDSIEGDDLDSPGTKAEHNGQTSHAK